MPWHAGIDVGNIYCDDNHVFCERENGTLGVYELGSGHLIRELGPAEGLGEGLFRFRGAQDVIGSKEVVAAATNGCEVVLNGF